VLFNSFRFLFLFLPVVVLLYWLIPRGYARLTFLIVASCVFYGLWDWRYIPLLLGTTLVDWAAGWAIVRSKSQRRRKLLLTVAVAINIGLLAYFKYRGFFFTSMNGLLKLTGMGEPLPLLRVLLPVGVSF
jgi:alginate O-acetyltransferase complex protein AlgI